MSEYVKLEDAMDLAKTGRLVSNGNYKSVCKALESLPAIDIVKCEDCRHNNREVIDEIEENWCEIFRCEVASDDFRSYGEKQVASKLNNDDDSLPTADLEGCKEKKCKLESDFISRQAAIEALGEEPDIALDTEEEWAERDAWARHVRAIKSLPPTNTDLSDYIDRLWKIAYERGKSERPKGEWFILEYESFTCNQCLEYVESYAESTQEARNMLENGEYPNYCPNCGADMKGGKK